MRRSTIVSLNRVKFFDFFSKNHTLFIMVIFFVTGVIIGTVSIGKSSNAMSIAERTLDTYIANRSGSSFMSIMISSASTSLLLLLIAFLFGASLLGMVLVPLLVFYRGFWYGTLSSLLYSTYAIKGIAFNAVMVIPASAIFLICLILAARESIGFSLVVAKLTLPRTCPANLYIDFKNYCGRYIFLSVIIIISSIVDAVLSCSFMGYFEF